MEVLPNIKYYQNVKILGNENQIGISVEALECKICFDLFDKIPGLLKCGHSFCYKCISLIRAQTVFKKLNAFQCPLCTKSLSLSDWIIPNYAFDDILQYASIFASQNKNIVFVNSDDQTKLLKKMKTQKHLYSEACKLLGSEKLRSQNKMTEVKKVENNLIFIIFTAIFLFILFALFKLAFL
uniref:RING-type domain-containing protein n=1 Tax=Panagrolaimus superbus TaxID=310955 RepID=A0A914YP71_9BILA